MILGCWLKNGVGLHKGKKSSWELDFLIESCSA